MEIRCPHCGKAFEMGASAAEHIRAQVRNNEMEREVAARVASELEKKELEHDRAIDKLKAGFEKERAEHAKALSEARSDAGRRIAELDAKLQSEAALKDAAVEQARMAERMSGMDEVSRLKADLAAKEREVDYYKDLKARMSTKMVGETLEQHCEAEFNKIRMAAFPCAEFHKDNDVSGSGSKGDYIFREMDGPDEVVSIMFEMKNDMDTTASRKKNEHFFKELDKDRREKGCEYAVLVSLLEPDSEFYNAGIADVSWQYPKMYVVRPQFFIPIITLIRNAAIGALDAKKKLSEMERQDLDLSLFKGSFEEWRDGFGDNLEQAEKRNAEAVDEIDKAIKRLEAAKAAIQACGKQLGALDKKVSGMTVEKLCKGLLSVQDRM